MQGKFITFEGADGAGKTSVMNAVVQELRDLVKIDIVETREPGGSPIAETIRRIILDPNNATMDTRTEALLYAAARRQHLVEKIKPALDANKMVICDRFVDSSLAYQGKGRRIGMDLVKEINNFATEGLAPDLTIYLDIDPETGIERLQKTTKRLDRLEIEGLSLQQRVRHGYLELLQQEPDRIIKVDARQPFANVVETSLEIIKQAFPEIF